MIGLLSGAAEAFGAFPHHRSSLKTEMPPEFYEEMAKVADDLGCDCDMHDSDDEGDIASVSVLAAISSIAKAALWGVSVPASLGGGAQGQFASEPTPRPAPLGLWNDPSDTYVGPTTAGVRHGDGAVCTKADGRKFLGSYRNGQPHKGTFVTPHFTYTGTFRNNLFHGSELDSCTLAFSDGMVYSGEFVEGRYHGIAKASYPNGDVYTGDFAMGERHGFGTLVCPDGSSYVGWWRKGSRGGEGVGTTPQGEMYEGQWAENRKHGPGVFTSADNVIAEGHWRDGKALDGPGWIIKFPTGEEYCGPAKNLRPHGVGTVKYSKSGKVYNKEWRWKEGKRIMQRSTRLEGESATTEASQECGNVDCTLEKVTRQGHNTAVSQSNKGRTPSSGLELPCLLQPETAPYAKRRPRQKSFSDAMNLKPKKVSLSSKTQGILQDEQQFGNHRSQTNSCQYPHIEIHRKKLAKPTLMSEQKKK